MAATFDAAAHEGAVLAGRYRLAECLDEGAFGAVYRAAHLAYEVELREVAVKVAKRPMSDAEARRTFADALMMARVADAAPEALRRHFVTVHDAGRCPDGGPLAGHPYVVMELVRGGSLKGHLRAGPFPLTRAAAYFEQVLEAVAFMHQGVAGPDGRPRPITHRDLKPGNVLVVRAADRPDLLKVTDFGLAVAVDTLLGWAESGGDLAYLAPESFAQDVCSPQTDVYMLGLVFHEMLTGANPFGEVGGHLRGGDEAARHEELRRIHLAARQAERFAALERHPELRQQPALARVVRTALQADPGARAYANAGEMLAAWREARRGDVRPRQSAPWEAVRRLTGEAEQCLAAGDLGRAESLLRQAMHLNRDRRQVPDHLLAGRPYLLLVEHLLRQGRLDEAQQLAMEGHQRRVCRSTCLALARCYEAQRSPLAAGLEQEAHSCADGE